MKARSSASETWVTIAVDELLDSRVGCLVLGDQGAHPHHLGERPVGDRVAVCEAAAPVPPHVGDEPVEVLLELPGESRLPDPGHSDDREEVGLALVGGGVEQLLDEAKLAVAADEGRLQAGRPSLATDVGDDAQRTPEPEGLRLPLQLVRAGVLVGDCRLARATGRVADQHGPGLCGRLDPGRAVHEVAGDHALVLGAERDRRLAGEGSGPQVEIRGSDLDSEGMDRRDELERGAHRTLGVVLLRDRRAPERHHGVADELLDAAAVALDHVPRRLEVAREELARLLGVAALGLRREADEVGEEDGDDAPLGNGRGSGGCGRRRGGGGAERRAALRAELRGRVGGRPARRARACERRPALRAELRAGRGDGLAGGAGDAVHAPNYRPSGAYAPAVDVLADLAENRTIDITTTGARSGEPRRIETWAWPLDGVLYLTGSPGRRDWYANLKSSRRSRCI